MVKTSLTTYTIKAYSNRQTEYGKYPELNLFKMNVLMGILQNCKHENNENKKKIIKYQLVPSNP